MPMKVFILAVSALAIVIGTVSCGPGRQRSAIDGRDAGWPPPSSTRGSPRDGGPISSDGRADQSDAAGTCATGLDPGFGQGGRYDINSALPAIEAVLAQPDGQVVVVGERISGPAGGDAPTVFAAVRLLADGHPDPTFGVDGTASAELLPNGRGGVSAGALQSDGKVIIVGSASSSANTTEWLVTRFNRDGSLDTSFGAGGVATSPTAEAAPTSVASAADGSVLVAGTARVHLDGYCCDGNAVLAKYDAQGRLDSRFGTGGFVTTPVGVATGDDYAFAVVVQPDGQILVGGSAFVAANDGGTPEEKAMILRYTAAGVLDSTFGTDGVVLTGGYPRANAIALQSDGLILVSLSPGAGSSDLVVARYTAAGALDPTFGSNGVRHIALPTADGGSQGGGASTLAALRDGTIVLAGPALSDAFFLAKLGPEGTLDSALGPGGVLATALIAGAATVTPDGKAIVAGARSVDAGATVVVERYCL